MKVRWSMNKVEINISNVSKKFKAVSALDNVSMRFETGKLYGIIGPAGAGKTTLFRLMLRLMQPAAGNIEYRADGRVISFSDFSENIAYMPQSQSLYADLSIIFIWHIIKNAMKKKKDLFPDMTFQNGSTRSIFRKILNFHG